MKKIINGKRYDTETAEHVASWDNGIYGRDFRACSEDLYRKRTGEYFLLGYGGPMTQYAECHGNETSGGTVLLPMTEEEARAWAEEKLDGDEYEEIFGAVPEEPEVNKLRSLREAAGLSQQALAGAAGMNLRQYQKYEAGEYGAGNMTLRNALALAAALGISPQDLI